MKPNLQFSRRKFFFKTGLTVLVLSFILLSVQCFAQQKINILLTQLSTSGSDTTKVRIYNQLAKYCLLNQPQSVKKYAEEGLALAIHLKDKKGIALMSTSIGMLDIIQGHNEAGKLRLDKALELNQEIHDKAGIADVYVKLGYAAQHVANYPKANEYYLKGLKIFESLKNKQGVIDAYMGLGGVCGESGNFEKAKEYFQRCIQIGNTLPVSESYIGAFGNIAIIYFRLQNIPEALNNFRIGLSKTEAGGFGVLRTKILLNSAKAFIDLKQYKEATRRYQEALNYSTNNNLLEQKAMALLGLAVVINNPKKSVDYFNEAFKIANQIGQKVIKIGIYMNMINFYKQHGNYQNAIATSDKYHALKDSLFTVEKAKEIANLQTTHELTNSKIQVQNLEIEKYKSTNQRNIILVFASAFLAIIIVIVFYYRKQQKLNELLNTQKQDLDDLNTIKDKIFSIIGHDLRGPMSSIAASFYLLENEILDPASKKKLFTRLRILHQSAHDTLSKLLYWGSSQLKAMSLNQVLFNPRELINTNFNLVGDPAKIKKIKVVCDVPETLQIFADPNYFEFIFRNILQNAIKFTNPKGIISVDYVDQEQKNYVTFAIRDNGVGMDEETADNIFKDKYISTKGTSDERGTGLGLMLCKRFIEENGGMIRVESKPGGGSAFYITFKASEL